MSLSEKPTSTDRPVPEWMRLPFASSGQRIGLFGGSFNPPHAGHRHVASTALKRLNLDSIWWLVSPGNPLKSKNNLLPLIERVNQCKSLTDHPKMRITAYESLIGNSYTANTVKRIVERCKDVSFVWVMGADNLKFFHLWENWQYIVKKIPLAIVDRPNSTFMSANTLFSQRFAKSRIEESDACKLSKLSAPGWVFLHAPRFVQSSTEIRGFQ